MNTETIKETIKETTQNTEEEKKKKMSDKELRSAYDILESKNEKLKEENIKLKGVVWNLI